jgi:DNA-binding transcriptional LysR family regulator
MAEKAGEDLEINYWREFVVLAQTSNFVEAANILFSSQPTLSKHIKNLESELGVRLFDRTSRKVEITKSGQLLLPYAKQIVEIQDKYNTVLQNDRATRREVLTVGSIRALAQYEITDIMGSFKKSRPKSTINVIQAVSEELKEMLRQKKCELAFIRSTNEVDKDLVKIPYVVDTLVAILPSHHSLAKQKTISLRMLAHEDFLLPEKNKALYKLCIDACKKNGVNPQVAHTDAKFENLVDLVIKGMGVALLMKQIALYVSTPKIAIIDISPNVTSQINLCYLKGAKLSDAAKHFILCTERCAKSRTKA